jgi:hypothetical protein
MRLIGTNDELINLLSGDLSLLSSKLYRIDIHNDATLGLLVELYIELLYAKTDKHIKLVFSQIEEYSFYYQEARNFYYVERYKFFQEDNHFYLSLDPYTEDETISPEDQDFILSTAIEGYYI